MKRYSTRNTFEYTTNGITFKSVLNPELSGFPSEMSNLNEVQKDTIKSFFAGQCIAQDRYDSADDINHNLILGSQILLNCVDIDWNDAELYGTDEIYIASTTDLLNYVNKIVNVLYNTKNNDITYDNVRPTETNIGNIYVLNSYSSQSDIEWNITLNSQYLINCIDIDWDEVNLGSNIELNNTTDFLTLINDLMKYMLLEEKREL